MTTAEEVAEILLLHGTYEQRRVEYPQENNGSSWDDYCRCGASLRTWFPGSPVRAGFSTSAWRFAEHQAGALQDQTP